MNKKFGVEILYYRKSLGGRIVKRQDEIKLPHHLKQFSSSDGLAEALSLCGTDIMYEFVDRIGGNNDKCHSCNKPHKNVHCYVTWSSDSYKHLRLVGWVNCVRKQCVDNSMNIVTNQYKDEYCNGLNLDVLTPKVECIKCKKEGVNMGLMLHPVASGRDIVHLCDAHVSKVCSFCLFDIKRNPISCGGCCSKVYCNQRCKRLAKDKK